MTAKRIISGEVLKYRNGLGIRGDYETHFASASHFTLTMPRSGSPARVVNVASYWAGDLDLDDLEFRSRPYNNNTAYRQSKQANRMLTVAFAQRLREYGVTVNACHPGDVNSSVSNGLGFGGHESPREGARTPAWLAIDAIGQRESGKYFEHMQMQRCRFGEDSVGVEAIYQACMAY
jgi:NAD(P)-dependent dehydrogenase (short-subunit alcohol dehydrogenase family)